MNWPNKRSPAPIIAAVLLLLPVLYVGSYLVLVSPYKPKGIPIPGLTDTGPNYRTGGEKAAWFFWPLEQIDRRVRPGVWETSAGPFRATIDSISSNSFHAPKQP